MSKLPPAAITPLFVTELYSARLSARPDFAIWLEDLDDTCRAFADEDEAGQTWSQTKGYLGYTSYASLPDLPARASVFSDLKTLLDAHVAAFADTLDFDLGGEKLKLDSMWINILEPMGHHSGHIHPRSILSGTFYVHVPDGASALRLEDPRLPMMMNAPLRKPGRPEHQSFVPVQPQTGDLLMWESWLRHEVPINMSEDVRISVSFNYG
ncbi:TIGR02466 family protein [Asticcacaulis sp. EMRT-3]|uniref:TIGR02466 family protein n=1 Tax=Asticcacaulis sp. EMRT-3 TaxID=3040349 RepID=UPI0024AFDDF4|nr:TIGR02466 family protein [Asticcacaulis sp. EMRT-3]MDI7774300.1 TIGR02466 family protein [Asticcacaulis sp. EMRT-3]